MEKTKILVKEINLNCKCRKAGKGKLEMKNGTNIFHFLYLLQQFEDIFIAFWFVHFQENSIW